MAPLCPQYHVHAPYYDIQGVRLGVSMELFCFTRITTPTSPHTPAPALTASHCSPTPGALIQPEPSLLLCLVIYPYCFNQPPSLL